MGYRKLATNDINDLLHRWLSQHGIRKIARETGIDRKTIRRYLAAAKTCDLGGGRDPNDDDVGRVIKRVQARPPRAPSEAWKRLMPFKEKIADCVDDDQRLRLQKARRMLADAGIHVTYWTLRRFALKARDEKSQMKRPDGNGPGGDGNGGATSSATHAL